MKSFQSFISNINYSMRATSVNRKTVFPLLDTRCLHTPFAFRKLSPVPLFHGNLYQICECKSLRECKYRYGLSMCNTSENNIHPIINLFSRLETYPCLLKVSRNLSDNRSIRKGLSNRQKITNQSINRKFG